MKILVTGGAGYIGSVTNALLRQKGHETVVFDNLATGHKGAVGDTKLIIGDLRNREEIEAVFNGDSFDAVVHFAALSLAGESMQKPYEYYVNNIVGGLNLLEAMRANDVATIVFSSTCAVYGYPKSLPVTEEAAIAPVSVYGSSKRMYEEILGWYEHLYGIRSAILRYFNAAGAMLDGSLGENHDNESHIIPVAFEAATGKREFFELFGEDYDTPDGTCIRDYIHVVDLANAHIQALEYLKKHDKSLMVNLGVGKGYSNKEVINMVERITGKTLPVVVKDKRPGDPTSIYADNTKAREILDWVPKHSDLQTIVSSAWKWYQNLG